jgi:hypothetical protein
MSDVLLVALVVILILVVNGAPIVLYYMADKRAARSPRWAKVKEWVTIDSTYCGIP